MHLKSVFAAAALLAATFVNAQVLTRFTFEGDTTTPSTGAGTATAIGGLTTSFATGWAGTGTGGRGWNTTGYPASGNPKTAGVQFSLSSTGFQDLIFTYDHRFSNTAANTSVVQLSVNGGAFSDIATFVITPAATGTGDTWFARTVNLPASANNQASIIVRVVSDVDPTTNAYRAARSTSNYGSGGTWRFDNVTLSGQPVPEPATLAALGLGAAALLRRRRG